jgi:hypothetical protein
MDLSGFLITLLTSAGASALLSGALFFLARNWISERIQQSIRHEYAQKLAHLNAELRNESEKNALLLKGSIEHEAERLRFATASVSQTQQAAIGRRLSALETLWEGVLATRTNIPTVMSFIDILTVDEYVTIKDNAHFQQMVGQISQEKLLAMQEDNVGSRERVRPYVGEYTWALVSTYQAIVLRVALLVQMGQEDEKKLNWHLDPGINQLLRSAMTETEMKQFEATRIGKVGWIQRNFESKILAAMQVVISGEKFGEEALHQAQLMEAKVQQVRPKMQISSANDMPRT